MSHHLFFFFAMLLLCFLSCQKSKTTPQRKKITEGFNKVDTFSFQFPVAEELATNPNLWKGFFKVRKMLTEKYHITSAASALYNVSALEKIAKKTTDSLFVSELDNAALHSRINAFQTAVLRLQDMAKIPAITAKEVRDQVREIYYLHDAITSKVNTFYARKAMDSLILFDENQIAY